MVYDTATLYPESQRNTPAPHLMSALEKRGVLQQGVRRRGVGGCVQGKEELAFRAKDATGPGTTHARRGASIRMQPEKTERRNSASLHKMDAVVAPPWLWPMSTSVWWPSRSSSASNTLRNSLREYCRPPREKLQGNTHTHTQARTS